MFVQPAAYDAVTVLFLHGIQRPAAQTEHDPERGSALGKSSNTSCHSTTSLAASRTRLPRAQLLVHFRQVGHDHAGRDVQGEHADRLLVGHRNSSRREKRLRVTSTQRHGWVAGNALALDRLGAVAVSGVPASKYQAVSISNRNTFIPDWNIAW
jgi:hypothetical protein